MLRFGDVCLLMNITEDGTLLVVPHAKENTATE